MRHKFRVLTVKKLLKSVYIYGSYRKIKTGLSLFLDHSVYLTFSRGRPIGLHGLLVPKRLDPNSRMDLKTDCN